MGWAIRCFDPENMQKMFALLGTHSRILTCWPRAKFSGWSSPHHLCSETTENRSKKSQGLPLKASQLEAFPTGLLNLIQRAFIFWIPSTRKMGGKQCAPSEQMATNRVTKPRYIVEHGSDHLWDLLRIYQITRSRWCSMVQMLVKTSKKTKQTKPGEIQTCLDY